MKPDNVFSLENAEWPALVVDGLGKIQRANPVARQIFEMEIEEGKTFLALVWAAENTATAGDFLAAVELGAVPSTLLKFKVKKGSNASFLVSVCPLHCVDGKHYVFQLFKPPMVNPAPAGATAFFQKAHEPVAPPVVDVASHKQKLDCALQLARTVALDFNNALTSILGHTSLLLSKADTEHPWRNSLVEIEKSAAKAAEIANDLAHFSRQEKDKTAQQAGNLNTLLQRCVDSFRTLENGQIEWSLQMERKLFAATFDEAKMQQAFMKILENAVQAVGKDGKITIQTRNLEVTESLQDRTVKLAPGNFVRVEIMDNGVGISPEALPRIFEPFFTTKGQSHRGLGLAWAYGILTNHGGGVAVSGHPGQGASARLYIPASKATVKDASVATADLCGIETVLMVDDEELLLNMGQLVLSSFGYRALIATNGKAALEILAQETVDVVVTDLVMPNMSGRELIERIREISPTTKIICSSGYVRPTTSQEAETYLQKPFTTQDLLRKVKEALAAG